MEALAERVSERLQREFGEAALVGVSYYDADGVGHVYRSEWAAEKYAPGQVDAIVDELRLEAIGHGVHEMRQNERLHATVRIYDELLDIAVPLTDTAGIAVALNTEGQYRVRDVVDTVEEVVESSEFEGESLQ